MSIQAVSWVLEHSRSEHSERLVLIALANHAGEGNKAWPSIPTIAREAGLGESTVRGAIKALLALGELEEEGFGPYRTRCFRLTLTPPGSAPPQDLHPSSNEQLTPQDLALDPAGSAPEPSRNRKEPSEEGASSAFPADMPESLRPVAQAVFATLAPIGDATAKARTVELAAVARAVNRYPDRDHLDVAADCEHYLLHGDGEGRYRDIVRFYGNTLRRAEPVKKRKPWSGALARELGRSAA